MKKIIIVFVFLGVLSSCHKNDDKKEKLKFGVYEREFSTLNVSLNFDFYEDNTAMFTWSIVHSAAIEGKVIDRGNHIEVVPKDEKSPVLIFHIVNENKIELVEVNCRASKACEEMNWELPIVYNFRNDIKHLYKPE